MKTIILLTLACTYEICPLTNEFLITEPDRGQNSVLHLAQSGRRKFKGKWIHERPTTNSVTSFVSFVPLPPPPLHFPCCSYWFSPSRSLLPFVFPLILGSPFSPFFLPPPTSATLPSLHSPSFLSYSSIYPHPQLEPLNLFLPLFLSPSDPHLSSCPSPSSDPLPTHPYPYSQPFFSPLPPLRPPSPFPFLNLTSILNLSPFLPSLGSPQHPFFPLVLQGLCSPRFPSLSASAHPNPLYSTPLPLPLPPSPQLTPLPSLPALSSPHFPSLPRPRLTPTPLFPPRFPLFASAHTHPRSLWLFPFNYLPVQYLPLCTSVYVARRLPLVAQLSSLFPSTVLSCTTCTICALHRLLPSPPPPPHQPGVRGGGAGREPSQPLIHKLLRPRRFCDALTFLFSPSLPPPPSCIFLWTSPALTVTPLLRYAFSHSSSPISSSFPLLALTRYPLFREGVTWPLCAACVPCLRLLAFAFSPRLSSRCYLSVPKLRTPLCPLLRRRDG
ncbi:hypothetical protein C7M84_022897 [Penaeus vannamei]|uniref:Uncharacterized protein n=1 Tax=Penaeus vannamei TaxID=6689 RepID=A0A423U5D5_PENVA|nr:hypothetical protein C7M84_022897 [Penaeus vannamei]